MTLRTITLENFQSHKDTTLDLNPGVNVLIGPSDSGKTAVVRALRWLTWNKPGGESFRSSWGGDTKVTIEFDDRVEVSRIRTDKANQYTIDDEIYEAFGTEPPGDVRAVLNLATVNLQQQLDRPFLLDSSPGQVAQYLNQVAHLETIDRALQRLGKWARDLEGNLRSLSVRREQLEESLEHYEYLPSMERDIEAVEQAETYVVDLRASGEALADTLSSYDSVDQQRSKLDILLRLTEPVDRSLMLIKERRELQNSRDSLDALLTRLQQVESTQQEIKPLRELQPYVIRALDAEEDWHNLNNRINSLAVLIEKVRQCDTRQTQSEENLKHVRHEFNVGMGDRCPLCGAKRSVAD